jgi:hypothetical protein
MFVPGYPPSDAAQLSLYIQDMERRIAQELSARANVLRLAELAVAPAKYADGDVIYADGTNYDPGGGEDLYVRLAGAWVKPGRLVLASKSANYTLTIADMNGGVYHPSSDNNARTFTIPANSSVAYPVGTTLVFINRAATASSIAITTDTMTLAGTATTGTRTLAVNGLATAYKDTSTTWLISGVGLT